jgi:hypothetical protein
MPNVAVGDFAKTVKPHCQPGILLLVIDKIDVLDYMTLCVENSAWTNHPLIWECKLLQGATAKHYMTLEARYKLPGQVVLVSDVFLRRIDPEEDPDAVPTETADPVVIEASS